MALTRKKTVNIACSIRFLVKGLNKPANNCCPPKLQQAYKKSNTQPTESSLVKINPSEVLKERNTIFFDTENFKDGV